MVQFNPVNMLSNQINKVADAGLDKHIQKGIDKLTKNGVGCYDFSGTVEKLEKDTFGKACTFAKNHSKGLARAGIIGAAAAGLTAVGVAIAKGVQHAKANKAE